MPDTIMTGCRVLWPCHDQNPHPARRLDPWDAAQLIMDRWDRNRFEAAPKLARRIICTIALLVPYRNEEQRAQAQAWACAEAPHWWGCLSEADVKVSHLRMLWERYEDSGRI